jgi:small subunit ribosomal protein S16
MAATIRLARFGAKKKPTYRIVVADSRAPRDGRFIERIGTYNPNQDPPVIRIEEERALEWLSQGARPSHTVRNLMRESGLLKRAMKGKST